MKRSTKVLIAATLVAVMAMAWGAGLVLAQTSDSAASNSSTTQDQASGPDGRFGRGPGGAPGCDGAMAGGEVVSVENDIITLKTPNGDEKKVQVNGDTVYKKRNDDGTPADASLADVIAGEKIGVSLTAEPKEGETPIAKAVMIGASLREHMRPTVGEVTAVDGDKVTIKTADGEQQFTIPQIQTGSRLGVAADADGNVKGLMYDPPELPADQAPVDQAAAS